jgi:hypothetical protein
MNQTYARSQIGVFEKKRGSPCLPDDQSLIRIVRSTTKMAARDDRKSAKLIGGSDEF